MADAALPYMNAYGKITETLQKIIHAQEPPRFTNDYLSGKLGIKSSSARPVINILKRMGFLNDDGSPTDRYKKYRNDNTRDTALAAGIKDAFAELYSRHEYAHDLDKEEIKNLIVEITGSGRGDKKVGAIVGTFFALTEATNFAKVSNDNTAKAEDTEVKNPPPANPMPTAGYPPIADQKVKMALSYTINLNLPESTNPDVYNAIFKSLKDNLLQ